jgi:cytochrome c-type biogenesis protein CcmH
MKLTREHIILGILLLLASIVHRLEAAPAPDLEDRTRAISAELRCVVCQNLSVADSPSEMAQQMRAIVRDQLEAGKSPEQIKEFFVSKYGEWVLLKPKTTGFSALLWILPYVVLGFGIIAALWVVRRWVRKKEANSDQTIPPLISQQLRGEPLADEFPQPDLDDDSQKARLLRERARLRNEIADLGFDFQAGKLSETDYVALKRDIETRAAGVVQEISSLPPEPAAKPTPKAASASIGHPQSSSAPLQRWKIIAGGTFLLAFGLVLGVMLTKAARPRGAENDTITGDFLTGTTSGSSEVRAALGEGKQAFEKQDFPKAIEAFKKVLATEPNNPEAHSYMGFILVQAGHGDGALMAFDKALSQAPNFPMALWGKGMVLYQDKKDYAGAREAFERLLNLIPPGEERNEVVKVLGEIPASGAIPNRSAVAEKNPGAVSPPSAQITGKITIDPKLKGSIDPNAALFIIARSATGASGPPLAVKKIDRPSFPVDFTLSQENVMMPGVPFAGRINITARLDKDGNPVTRTPGDISGDYSKNPIEVGTKNVDVVIDQVMK